MEPLLKQLRQLPGTLAGLPAGVKLVLVVGAIAAIAAGAWSAVSTGEGYQYAFTNLTAEDSTEAAATLKAAGVSFRLEAGGSALAVPASKVYDARLLLASAGLPRGGGVGFEIFDRGDLGVSEFTQRVNLRRAIEGELARTISRLSQIRSARVHLTLPARGLYRDQDAAPAAAVVVTLQPGRTLGDREISGIRHLVSSAVPGLAANAVAVVDGSGQVLSQEGGWGEAMGFQRRLEHDIEQRVVDILEQAVGRGAVVARVAATVDTTETQTSAQVVDPDSAAVRSERRVAQGSTTDGGTAGGVAGAAANQPLQAAAPTTPGRARTVSTSEDQTRNYELSLTTTTTVARFPRLKRLSVAVLVDAVNGQPRAAPELKQLGELAKRAVGFDEERGDTFDISSSPFARSAENGGEAPAPVTAAEPPWRRWAAIGGGALLAVVAIAFALRRRQAPVASELPLLPGARVAEIEAALARDAAALPPAQRRPGLDPAASLRDRARELAVQDPTRAAHILKAWMAQESASPLREPSHG